MKVEDIDQVLEVEHAVFTAPWSKQAFYNELINNHFAYYIVATNNQQIIGYGGLWVIIDEAHITNVAIHPAYQGRRLGYQLMMELIDVAKHYGADKMTLEVRVSNFKAQRLYKRLGFKEHGIRKGYYTDNNEDALIMWVNINEINRETE